MKKKVKMCVAKTREGKPCKTIASLGNLCLVHYKIKRGMKDKRKEQNGSN